MNILVDALIEWPRSVARHLDWLGPLFARIVTGWVFLWTGWGKLTHLPLVTENFEGWGIPAPQLLAPFVSGVEFFGGILLLAGLADAHLRGRARHRHDRRREVRAMGRKSTRCRRCSGSRKSCISRCSCGSPSPEPGASRSIPARARSPLSCGADWKEQMWGLKMTGAAFAAPGGCH